MDENYKEIIARYERAKPGKEMRAIHKELKKYGDGVFFYTRYPKFTRYLAWCSLIFGVLALIVDILQSLLK